MVRYVVFPWDLNITFTTNMGLKYTWSNKVMADTLSTYIYGLMFFP